MSSEPQAPESAPEDPSPLESVFERLPTGLALLDVEGRLTRVNPAFERIVDYNRLDLIGRSFTEFVHPDDVAECTRAFQFVGRDRTERQLEVRLVGEADRTRHCAITLTPIQGPGGELQLIAALCEDTTERRAEADRLKAGAERYRLLVDRANDIIFNIDLKGHFVYVNPTASRLTKFTEDELRGMHFLALVRPDYRPRAEQFYADQVDRRLPSTYFEFPMVTKEGDEIWLGQYVQLVADGARTKTVQAVARDITERRRAEEALRASEERLRALISSAPVILWAADAAGRLTLCEGQGLKGLGRTPDALVGRQVRETFDDPALDEYLQRALEGDALQVEMTMGGRTFDSWYAPMRDVEGAITGVIGVAVDITEHRQLQNQLHQIDKMDAIGQLAGGVAHDFNNQLTAILGYAEVLLRTLDEDDERRADVTEITRAGRRAASVTEQLLAFGRKQPLRPEVIDLNGVISEMDLLLRRTVREDIIFEVKLADTLDAVRADPSQVEQIIMNLVLNARDAMPDGGRLTLITRMADVGVAETRAPMPPGRYVTIEVTDSGRGMDAEVQAHLFEPFFTTKEQGKGTGLGLASVYGIVKQSGGYIWVTSEVDRGSTFTIHLPPVHEPVDAATPVTTATAPVGGTETVLVVEDDPTVRALACTVLGDQGYHVLRADGPTEALRISATYDGRIDLLVSDIVMPVMNGLELAMKIIAVRPLTRVIHTTGYTRDDTLQDQLAAGHLLEKPFMPNALLHKVREVLDVARETPPGRTRP